VKTLGNEVIAPAFLTSALNGGEWSLWPLYPWGTPHLIIWVTM